MKLLNINAAAELLISKYDGAKLATNSTIFDVPIVHNKNKQILVSGLLDALKSLFPSEKFVRTNVDSKMGFVIGNYHCECILFFKSVLIFNFKMLNVYLMLNLIRCQLKKNIKMRQGLFYNFCFVHLMSVQF